MQALIVVVDVNVRRIEYSDCTRKFITLTTTVYALIDISKCIQVRGRVDEPLALPHAEIVEKKKWNTSEESG